MCRLLDIKSNEPIVVTDGNVVRGTDKGVFGNKFGSNKNEIVAEQARYDN
jgi:hypothetical protein